MEREEGLWANIIGGGGSAFNTGYPATAPMVYAYAKVAATTAKSIREAPRSPSAPRRGFMDFLTCSSINEVAEGRLSNLLARF